MNLPEAFQQYYHKELQLPPLHRLLIAVSGGVDSVVLCHLCYNAGIPFEMAHCNFQLRSAESDRDALFVQQLAKQFQVPLHSTVYNTQQLANERKESIELAARNLRYQWFASLLQQLNEVAGTQRYWLATAHHADDNVETILMHFFRGAGIRGLRGILPKQEGLVRPLLFATRQSIEEYADLKQINYVSDSSNAESVYTRNFFRNELIPMIASRFPGAVQNIRSNAERFREVEMLYQQALQQQVKKWVLHKGTELHIPILKLKKTAPTATILLELLLPYGFTAQQLPAALHLLDAEPGKYLESNTHRVFNHRRWLIVAPLQTVEARHILLTQTKDTIVFDTGILHTTTHSIGETTILPDLKHAYIDLQKITFPLVLRKWKTGDYFYPLGMKKKKKKVGRFLSDLKLSLLQKENTWVVEMNQQIIWVVGWRLDERFKVLPSTNSVWQLTVTDQRESGH